MYYSECYLIALHQHVIEPHRLYDQGPSSSESNIVDICWAIHLIQLFWYCRPLVIGRPSCSRKNNEPVLSINVCIYFHHVSDRIFWFRCFRFWNSKGNICRNLLNFEKFDLYVVKYPVVDVWSVLLKNFETFELFKGEHSYKIQQQHQ